MWYYPLSCILRLKVPSTCLLQVFKTCMHTFREKSLCKLVSLRLTLFQTYDTCRSIIEGNWSPHKIATWFNFNNWRTCIIYMGIKFKSISRSFSIFYMIYSFIICIKFMFGLIYSSTTAHKIYLWVGINIIYFPYVCLHIGALIYSARANSMIILPWKNFHITKVELSFKRGEMVVWRQKWILPSVLMSSFSMFDFKR
jgi:hypothetical protein